MVRQEPGNAVLAYDLPRCMMGQAYSPRGEEPYQTGFRQSALYLCSYLPLLPEALSKLAKVMDEILNMAASFVLTGRRVRHYPGAIKRGRNAKRDGLFETFN